MDNASKQPSPRVSPVAESGARAAAEPGRASPKPVFIVGFPRSGTTWMMWLLAKLPSVVALQQSGLFHSLRDFEKWWGTGHRFSTDGPPGSTGEESFGRTTSILSKSDYYRVCRPACEHIFARLAGAGSAEIVVEQTPENMEFEETIRGVFPDARFLHVLRDPRDACLSMRKAATAWENEFPGRPIHIANRWVEYINRAKKLQSSTDRYLEVRYEDLKSDGPAELARIADWLGISVDSETCAAAFKACRLEKMRDDREMPRGFFGKGRIGAWKDEFSKSDLRVIEYIVGPEMERFGYERQHPRSTEKPFRLSVHEKMARIFAKWRGRWLRASRVLRKASTHRSDELLYTHRKESD